MSVEINSALVAKIADGFVKAPRLACEEFQAIVSAFRELHSEFTTRVKDASSEYLEEHIELHHSDAYYNLLNGPRYRDLDEDVLSAMLDDNYQELVESLSQHVKEQIFNKARAATSEYCNTRAIEIACRGELFCRTIEMATMEKADPFELAGTSRLRTIVCQDLIPIGHPEWWKSVFDPAFKSVEANSRTFTDRVAYQELKARAPAGPWPEADRDAILECLSGQQLKLFNVRNLRESIAESILQPTTMVEAGGQGGKGGDETNPPAAPTAEYIIEDKGENYEFHALGELCSLKKSVGVERLLRVVTSPDRKVSIIELYQIGAEVRSSSRLCSDVGDRIDRDAQGISERKLPDASGDSRFDRETSDEAWEKYRDLIFERDLARRTGNTEEAERLTKIIDTLLETHTKFAKKVRDAVKNTIDPTIERFKKAGRQKLHEHFFSSVQLSEDKQDYIFAPAGLPIVWRIFKR